MEMRQEHTFDYRKNTESDQIDDREISHMPLFVISGSRFCTEEEVEILLTKELSNKTNAL